MIFTLTAYFSFQVLCYYYLEVDAVRIMHIQNIILAGVVLLDRQRLAGGLADTTRMRQAARSHLGGCKMNTTTGNFYHFSRINR